MAKLTPTLSIATLAFMLALSARGGDSVANSLDWHLSEFATISNQVLVVDVPADAPIGMYGATADLDLTPFEGRSLGATVMAEAGPITASPKGIHGLKFMFHFANTLSGLDCWPEARRPKTPFARQKLEVDDGLSGGNRSASGTLFLGLQGVTGRIVFDLSTLEIVSADPFYPQVNGDLVCAYTDRVRNAPQKRGVMLPARACTEDDFKTLHEWGATLARYQIVDGPVPAKDEAPETFIPRYRAWLDGMLDRLDRDMLPWAVKYGIDIVVDLHRVPGGFKDGVARVFCEKTYTDEFVDCWRRIASRFRGREGIYGYDLINEPNQHAPAETDYWTLQRLAAEAIREIDPETPIVIESNHMDSPLSFSYLSPLDLTNVIYQVHMYEPGDFTHQLPHTKLGIEPPEFVRYPSPGHDKALARRVLEVVRKFERKHGAKIFVGEFSASAWAPGAEKYIADCIDLFREYGWDWTYHAFREWEGWSVEHEPVAFGTAPECFRPSADNPRKRALIEGMQGK